MLPLENPAKRILLISNSTLYGSDYLDHCAAKIHDFLGKFLRPTAHVLFVPYALFDRDAYAARARERFAALGYRLESVHQAVDAQRAVQRADAVFVGGGNTFRLLKGLYDHNLLAAIRGRVEQGMPYIGSSAGSIVACPSLKTTKDMPVVEPPSFSALGLVQFQISPHYLDPDPNSKHMGETQEERINQFLEENDAPVVGLREGGLLRVEQGGVVLHGTTRARIFRRGHDPVEAATGSTLSA
jgi:dipeptidase E